MRRAYLYNWGLTNCLRSGGGLTCFAQSCLPTLHPGCARNAPKSRVWIPQQLQDFILREEVHLYEFHSKPLLSFILGETYPVLSLTPHETEVPLGGRYMEQSHSQDLGKPKAKGETGHSNSCLSPGIAQVSLSHMLEPPKTLTHSITSWVLAAGTSPDQTTVKPWAKETGTFLFPPPYCRLHEIPVLETCPIKGPPTCSKFLV